MSFLIAHMNSHKHLHHGGLADQLLRS